MRLGTESELFTINFAVYFIERRRASNASRTTELDRLRDSLAPVGDLGRRKAGVDAKNVLRGKFETCRFEMRSYVQLIRFIVIAGYERYTQAAHREAEQELRTRRRDLRLAKMRRERRQRDRAAEEQRKRESAAHLTTAESEKERAAAM